MTGAESLTKSIEVLVIEDNPGDLHLAQLMLQGGSAPFHVSSVERLSKGMRKIVEQKIDVVLLDLDLPDSSGIDTFNKLKEHAEEVPIVILSGLGDEDLAREAVRDGAQDYLVKGKIGFDNDLLERVLLYAIDRQQTENKIRNMAYHDSLTGLSNRSLLFDRFTMALAGNKRYHKKIGLFVMDIDYFKKTNDSYGHEAGDELLKEYSDRLITVVRQTDTVCRLGGDEFALLVPEINETGDVVNIVEKLLAAVRQPFNIQGHEISVTTSIGYTVVPEDGEDLKTLLRRADSAMYRVKESGRNGYLRWEE